MITVIRLNEKKKKNHNFIYERIQLYKFEKMRINSRCPEELVYRNTQCFGDQ